MARLDHRAAEDHRSADEPHRPWRHRGRRVGCRDSVAAGLRVFREAHHARLGSHPHRARLGSPDGSPRIQTICGAGRRLGERSYRAAGSAPACGIDWHSHQHACHRPSRHRQGGVCRCAGAIRPLSRRKAGVRPACRFLQARTGLRTRDGEPPANALRDRRFAGRDGRLDARPRRAQHGAHVACLRRSARGAYARRHPRQRHTVLAHEHDGLFSSPVLGKQARVLCAEKRPDPGRSDRLSGRALSGPEELDRESVSQAHSLQQGRKGWPLRRVGAAGDVRDRAPRRFQVAAYSIGSIAMAALIQAEASKHGEVVHARRDLDRRRFLGTTATALAATQLGMLGSAKGLIPHMEGELSSLVRATEWLNSPPLTAAGLRGKVVLIDFCTYTCINWLRTLPYVRAWAAKYKDQGLVVIGVHTPEFVFEKDVDNVRRAVKDMRIEYPIAMDNEYAIWRGFNNEYWPALYLVDGQGHIRHHYFGEGEYEQSERMMQQLLAEAGVGGIGHELVAVDARGIEAAADWDSLQSPENYLGYGRTENFASPGGAVSDTRRVYAVPTRLRLNQWALSGDWTVGKQATLLNQANGRIAYRFHARDLHLVMGPAARGRSVRFHVLIDGQPVGAVHGGDGFNRATAPSPSRGCISSFDNPSLSPIGTSRIKLSIPALRSYT